MRDLVLSMHLRAGQKLAYALARYSNEATTENYIAASETFKEVQRWHRLWDNELKNQLDRYILERYVEPAEYVYLAVTLDGLFKIGHSKIPFTRVKQLNKTTPFAKEWEAEAVAVVGVNNARLVEKLLHESFSPTRINGEWYTDIDPQKFVWIAEHFDKEITGEAGTIKAQTEQVSQLQTQSN